MSAVVDNWTKLNAHVRIPLFRNGYALVISALTTSALGMLYWIIAARLFSADAVGLNSALIVAMTFLTNLAQLNQFNVLNRFVPNAGKAAGKLIVGSYLSSSVIVVAVCITFIAGIQLWAPSLKFLQQDHGLAIWFTLATLTWSLFVLQDGALTGLREGTWVLAENLVYALLKAVLLVALASLLPDYGIFASWMIPLPLLVILVTALMFGRLVPRHAGQTDTVAEPIIVSDLLRFAFGDYFASMITSATVAALPFMVLNQLGAAENAYYYIAWTIAYSLYLIGRNMSMSLIAEGALARARLYEYSYRVLINTSRLLVPVVALIVLAAPLLLRFFGADYADASSTLLRLLCLSTLPNMVVTLYMGVLRVQRRMKRQSLIAASVAILVLTLTYVLLPIYGISGVGFAWLFAQTAVAVVLLATELRHMWAPYLHFESVLRHLAGPRTRLAHRHSRSQVTYVSSLVPDVLSTLPTIGEGMDRADWHIQKSIDTVSGVSVFVLGAPAGRPEAILKVPQTPSAERSMLCQTQVLNDLRADARLHAWRHFLPTILAEGSVRGQAYTLENVLPGVDARQVFADAAIRSNVLISAATAIGQLHSRTASPAVVDSLLFRRWVEQPMEPIRQLCLARSNMPDSLAALDRLTAELHTGLAGKVLIQSWIHGDFVADNIMVSPNDGQVTGVIDWSQGEAGQLPHIDLYHLILATRMYTQRRELGDVVREMLDEGRLSDDELCLLSIAQTGFVTDVLDTRTMVLLAWMHHISTNLLKSEAFSGRWLWIAKNIDGVLSHL